MTDAEISAVGTYMLHVHTWICTSELCVELILDLILSCVL